MDSPRIELGLLDCQPNVLPLNHEPTEKLNAGAVNKYL